MVSVSNSEPSSGVRCLVARVAVLIWLAGSLMAISADRTVLFDEARANARKAQLLLVHARQWLADEVRHLDPQSGLLTTPASNKVWNTRDTAADVYPFFTWAAYLLAPEVFENECRRILEFERTKTCTRGRLPWDFDTATQTLAPQNDAQQVFGASEYVKDGLVAIVELVGRGPWAERMREIEEDCFQFALWETPQGRLPMNNLEVNGDHLQSLARLFTMTGDRRYLEWAERIAEYYFETANYRPVQLRDHACEMIGGFALLYAVEKQIGSPKAARYEPQVKRMLDDIVDYGLTPEGLMHAVAHTNHRGPLSVTNTADLTHNWGYNFVAFLLYADLARAPEYAEVVDRALRGLAHPTFHNAPWAHGGFDRGLADSMEGAIYLLASRDVPEGHRWLDAEAEVLNAKSWPLDKFGANIVRTALQYAWTRARGTWVHPWREDVAWGAVERNGALWVSVCAEKAWSGRLVFDSARYRTVHGFKKDYPRINYLPALFVGEPDASYQVQVGQRKMKVRGRQLIEGLPLEIKTGTETQVIVTRRK